MGEITDERVPRGPTRDPLAGLPTYLGPSGQPIAPWRQSLDTLAAKAVDWTADFLASHWLFLANVVVGVYAFLPFVAPALLAAGLTGPADLIYSVYSYLCHQRADRSWFLFGEKMAYCQRDAVMYPTMFLVGVAYAFRRGIRPLSLLWFLLLIAPLAVDGTTQAFMLRESTPELRAITGALFGVAVVWLCYPHVQRVMGDAL